MAKQKATFSFKDIVGLTDGLIKKTSIDRETEKSLKSRGTIGTGIYILNAALSTDIYGGIQNNRITTFGGASGVGKSYLCYNICRQAQAEGYSIIYIDTEFAIELDQLPGYGIDTSEDKFILLRNNVIEDLKLFTTQLLDSLKEQKQAGKEIDKFMIVLDSVGQLASRKEVEDAKDGKEKADFTKAKALASYFRIINSDLGNLLIPMLITNHTYQSMDMFPVEHMKGGCQISTAIINTRDGLKTIKDVVKGDYVLTLDGYEEVLETHKFEKETIEFQLDNGEILEVSKEHKFLIHNDYMDQNSWKTAEELNENDIILSL